MKIAIIQGDTKYYDDCNIETFVAAYISEWKEVEEEDLPSIERYCHSKGWRVIKDRTADIDIDEVLELAAKERDKEEERRKKAAAATKANKAKKLADKEAKKKKLYDELKKEFGA